MAKFCPITGMLLEEITQNQLLFKSSKVGTVYEATPEDTLLVSEGIGELGNEKYVSTLAVAAFNPINSRVEIKEGCAKCGRKVVSLQRLGEEQRAIYSCLCSHSWQA